MGLNSLSHAAVCLPDENGSSGPGEAVWGRNTSRQQCQVCPCWRPGTWKEGLLAYLLSEHLAWRYMRGGPEPQSGQTCFCWTVGMLWIFTVELGFIYSPTSLHLLDYVRVTCRVRSTTVVMTWARLIPAKGILFPPGPRWSLTLQAT